MRSMRPLTHLLNVCTDTLSSYCYSMTTVFTQSYFVCGMQIIAQVQVKVSLLISYDKHYLIFAHLFPRVLQSLCLWSTRWCIYLYIINT